MSFSLKTFAGAFATAWKELKIVGKKTESFLATNGPAIQNAVHEGEVIVSTVVPALAPAVSLFGTVEEAVMGKIFALAHNASTATDVQTLFQEEWPLILALKDQIVNHPVVTAAPGVIAANAASNQPKS